jgi:hypothetical protein
MALAASPLNDAYPATTWTVADSADLRERHGWYVHQVLVKLQKWGSCRGWIPPSP